MKAKKKTVECSLGVYTTEATAARIDELLKTLPKDKAHEYRRKAVTTPDTQVEESNRCDVSYISTRAMDRDKEIVLPEGIDLTEFRLNPVVLFGHDQLKPVGRCQWIKPDERGIIAKTFYPRRPASFEGDWLTDFAFAMVVADVLRGKSIGFLPVELREPTAEELAEFPAAETVITKSVLLEYSLVAVPSNPLALVETINKGIGLEFWQYKAVGRIGAKTSSPASSKAAPAVQAVERKVSPTRPKTSVAEELAKLSPLDPERIAELAVKKLLDRWQV